MYNSLVKDELVLGSNPVIAKYPDRHRIGESRVRCGSDGKFHQERAGDHIEGAIANLLDASDKEPVSGGSKFMMEIK